MSSLNAQYIETTTCCGLNNGRFSSNVEFKQEDVDAILVQGMQDLSFDELQREQEDLHGVGEAIDKGNNKELATLLQAFDDHIQRKKKNTVYESAELVSRTFVNNPELRLQFLHGHRWDPKDAAEKFLTFLEIKKQLFGMNKIGKEITLDDLDEDDIENILGGSLQILPGTDRSGRRIILELPGLRSFKTLRNELRARFYMLMNLRTSNASRGAVWISYAVGQYRDKMNGKGFVEMTTLGMCMPMHCAGIHLCTDDPSEAIICKAAMALTPPHIKAKTRIHYGSHTECQYRLSTYGLPRASLPFTIMENDIMMEDHLAWYHQLLKPEKGTTTNTTTNTFAALSTKPADQTEGKFEPHEHDVLFAGRKFSGNGNEILRAMASQHAQAYAEGNARVRRDIVDNMVEEIKSKGGRFLKLNMDGSSWIEVSMPEVREKIFQMFRNLRRPRASQQPKPAVVTVSHLPIFDESDILQNDVLFGRKAGHEGNHKLRMAVEGMAAEYDAATRGRKKQLVDSLIETIRSSNGRFLRQVEGGKWQEVQDETVILSKVSSHFRNYRRQALKRQ